MKKLKAVVVGAGWSAEGHTKAFQHYGVEVLAICARKPDIVQKVASGLDVPEASTDWRKSLLKHKPDIVAVTTPAILRTEVIELAVELGCHIISEKPLALTAAEAGTYLQSHQRHWLETCFRRNASIRSKCRLYPRVVDAAARYRRVNGSRYRIQPSDSEAYVFKYSEAVELDEFVGARWWCLE